MERKFENLRILKFGNLKIENVEMKELEKLKFILNKKSKQ